MSLSSLEPVCPRHTRSLSVFSSTDLGSSALSDCRKYNRKVKAEVPRSSYPGYSQRTEPRSPPSEHRGASCCMTGRSRTVYSTGCSQGGIPGGVCRCCTAPYIPGRLYTTRVHPVLHSVRAAYCPDTTRVHHCAGYTHPDRRSVELLEKLDGSLAAVLPARRGGATREDGGETRPAGWPGPRIFFARREGCQAGRRTGGRRALESPTGSPPRAEHRDPLRAPRAPGPAWSLSALVTPDLLFFLDSSARKLSCRGLSESNRKSEEVAPKWAPPSLVRKN